MLSVGGRQPRRHRAVHRDGGHVQQDGRVRRGGTGVVAVQTRGDGATALVRGEPRRDELDRTEPVDDVESQVEDGVLLGVGGRRSAALPGRLAVRVATGAEQGGSGRQQQGAPRRPWPGVRAVRHPFRPERETPSMMNRCAIMYSSSTGTLATTAPAMSRS